MPDDKKTTPRPSGDQSKPLPAGIDPATGSALRSIYQKTIDESVPDEMLDLLGKLS